VITTSKNDYNATADNTDVLVRVGKFPTSGNKLVIQKGTTIISVPVSDLLDFICAVAETAFELKG
jgi:hypothetical protein